MDVESKLMKRGAILVGGSGLEAKGPRGHGGVLRVRGGGKMKASQ